MVPQEGRGAKKPHARAPQGPDCLLFCLIFHGTLHQQDNKLHPTSHLSIYTLSQPMAQCSGDEASVEVGHDFGTSDAFSRKEFTAFVGPGLLMSIAYIDPGNFEVLEYVFIYL